MKRLQEKEHHRLSKVLHNTDLLVEKLGLSLDFFDIRLESLKKGDKERVEFIEKMMVQPLDMQIQYLAEKISNHK